MVEIKYQVVQELLKLCGINPYDFMILSSGRTIGYFPDLPDREPLVSVDRLVHVLWEDSDE